MTLLPSILVALCTPVPASIVPAQDFEADLRKAGETLAEDLTEVAEWCGRKKYDFERDRLYEEALRHDPENKKARKGLAYEKDRKSGEWVQDAEYRTPRNRGRVDQEELDAKERAPYATYRDRIVALLDQYGDAVTVARRREIVAQVQTWYPDDGELLGRAGYVAGWEDRPWVLPESKVAHDRREELKAFGKRLREEAPACSEAQPTDAEAALGLKWRAGELEGWRALSDAEGNEADEILGVVYTVRELVRRVLDPEAQLPEGLTVYTIDGFDKLDQFAAHPTVKGRASLNDISSLWLDWHTLAAWDTSRTSRLDAVSRQCMAWLLKDRFGITSRHGWIFEGFGLYISYRAVGTRLGIFVREAQYKDEASAEDLLKRLKGSDANWFALAHSVLTSKYKPDLVFLLGKDVNHLTGEELLYGYTIAAYLMEVLPEQAPVLLRRIGKGEAPATVLEEVTGRKLAELETLLIAWLDDVKH